MMNKTVQKQNIGHQEKNKRLANSTLRTPFELKRASIKYFPSPKEQLNTISLCITHIRTKAFSLKTKSDRLPRLSDRSRYHLAYFSVQIFAFLSCSALSDTKSRAMEPTKGSSGFASHSSDVIDSRIFDKVSAGHHLSFRMSKQIIP